MSWDRVQTEYLEVFTGDTVQVFTPTNVFLKFALPLTRWEKFRRWIGFPLPYRFNPIEWSVK